MRAVMMKEYGPPDVLVATDVPDPEPGPGQVLIDVAHAGITFVETQFRATGFGPFAGDLPMIPGNGVAGTTGGRRVISSTGGSGGYAERVAVDAELTVDVPPELALDDAVALLADGRTALMLTDAAAIEPGAVVLIEAAAGGLGSLLVQLAKRAGATVVAAAGGEAKLAVARDLGADLTVDYRTDRWDDAVRSALGNVDVVFDAVGGDVADAAFGLIGRGGKLLPYGAASGRMAGIDPARAADRDVEIVAFRRPTPVESAALSGRALAEAAAGRLRPVIGQRFPLERAADAHRAIESRATLGKTVLDV